MRVGRLLAVPRAARPPSAASGVAGRSIPESIELVRIGAVDPSRVITQIEPAASAVEAYERFDRREPSWLKVELDPTEV